MASVIHGLRARRDGENEQPIQPADLGVLLVDDELAVLAYAKRVLESQGYRPRLASSGTEALRVASTMDRVDVLVTDVIMPLMTGEELARRLRERNSDLKVLYVTAYGDVLSANTPLLCDGEAFLDKPFSIAGMGQAVALLFDGHLAAPATA